LVRESKDSPKSSLFISEKKYMESVNPSDVPPYDSLDVYDAKIWIFVKQHGQDGDFIWNVA
jgi:hypothetical protein